MSLDPAPPDEADVGRSTRWSVAALCATGFAARLVARRLVEPGSDGGYQLFLWIAQTFSHGGGFCERPGESCAVRVPGYPLFLSLFLRGNELSGLVVIAQAALGASLVWIAFALGKLLFDRRTGLVAAAAVALSPYAVVHDTALQDTVLFDVLLALGVLCLLRLEHTKRAVWAAAAGLSLAGAVLVTARMAVMLLVAIAWPLWRGSGPLARRLQHAALVAVPVAILVGGWMIRNDRLLGAPVLTTVSGESLWTANNPGTLDRFPIESIDVTKRDAYAALTPEAAAELASVSGNDVATDRLLDHWAWDFIIAHPLTVVRYAATKVAVPLLAMLSPVRGTVTEALFLLVYLPIHVLAAYGWWRARGRWRDHALPLTVLLAFLLVTAAFWSHTSHAVFLDPLWFVYAASMTGRATVLRNRGANI